MIEKLLLKLGYVKSSKLDEKDEEWIKALGDKEKKHRKELNNKDEEYLKLLDIQEHSLSSQIKSLEEENSLFRIDVENFEKYRKTAEEAKAKQRKINGSVGGYVKEINKLKNAYRFALSIIFKDSPKTKETEIFLRRQYEKLETELRNKKALKNDK